MHVQDFSKPTIVAGLSDKLVSVAVALTGMFFGIFPTNVAPDSIVAAVPND